MPEKFIKPALKIGLFGIGLEAYWKQFDGLEKRLRGNIDQVLVGIADRPTLHIIHLFIDDDRTDDQEQ